MYQKQNSSDSFFSHSIDNSNKLHVNKDLTSFTINDTMNDQNDDGYETGVSDMMSLKYKHHPSFATLPPSSPFSSISSISSTTPTSFANSQQQQSPIYNMPIGNNATYYHHHHQQYQQAQMLNLTENHSQSYNHHLSDNMMYGHNDPYNFANHEFQQQMHNHFGEVNNEGGGKMLMSLETENSMKDAMKFSQPQKYNENGTGGNPGDIFSTLLADDKNISLSDKSNSTKNEATKKRGRKRKLKDENCDGSIEKAKGRRKHDRFNGMSEEELITRHLPDHLNFNLDILIIGINPGLFAAYKGHHYSGPGNHFWKCLYLSGLTPVQMTADEDFKLLEQGIGFTNIVQRPTKGSADLTRKEIKDGCKILLEKLQKYRPKVAVFNGKLIYEVFSGKKDFYFGKQGDLVEGTNTHIWVMPSSSARCAQLPRAADKVPFYTALKKFKDYMNGLVAEYNENDYVFSDPKYNQMCPSSVNTEKSNHDSMDGEGDPLNINRKKRGRPKKKNFEDDAENVNCVETKELDNESWNDKQNSSKKKRGRPRKGNEDTPTKATKEKKANKNNANSNNTSYDNKMNKQTERPLISPAMESSSSFSNHHQPGLVQQQQQQQQSSSLNGNCNQSSRNQSPSMNVCHQTNLDMKPMMISDIHSPHQQDSNIAYQQHRNINTQSPLVKEESLNSNHEISYNSQQLADRKPQHASSMDAITNGEISNSLDSRNDFKLNGITSDNLNLKYQQQPQQYHQSNISAVNNQLQQSLHHPQSHAFQIHQPTPQQAPQHQLFQNSTPHLISNITSESTTVYQQQQRHEQVDPTYSGVQFSLNNGEKSFGSGGHFGEQNKDISIKSLSGLESLVDQITNTNPEQETTPQPQTPIVTPTATPAAYAPPYGTQHYGYHPSHPTVAHGQHFSSPFPIGSFPTPSYPSFTNYHQNLINQSHHVGMPVNPVYPTVNGSGYHHPHPSSTLLPYSGYTQAGSGNYYNPMFDRINF